VTERRAGAQGVPDQGSRRARHRLTDLNGTNARIREIVAAQQPPGSI
jgi:hypothetical protein